MHNPITEARLRKQDSWLDVVRILRGPTGFGLFVIFAVYFGKSNFSGIYGMYAMQRYGYSPAEIGSLLMFVGIVYALVQGLVVGPLTRRFGEHKVIIYCLFGNGAGFVFVLLANSYLMIAASISFFIASNAALKPSALAYISKNTSVQQGTAMGYAEVFMSVGRTLGPLGAGLAFDIHRDIPFIGGAVFFLLIFAGTLTLFGGLNPCKSA